MLSQFLRKRARQYPPVGTGLLIGVVILGMSPRSFAAAAPNAAQANTLQRKVLELEHAGKLDEAIRLAEEELELRKQVSGPDHPYTAMSLYHLGKLYGKKLDYSKAASFYGRALAIRERVLGDEDRDTIRTLNALGTVYFDVGEFARAEPFAQRALAGCEKKLGPNHPDTATCLNNLAALYKAMADYSKAEPLFARALTIWEKTGDPNRPDLAGGIYNLARLCRDLGEYGKAESLYQRALAIREKALGPEHPDTARSASGLASLYETLGKYFQAERLYKRALETREEKLGREHPLTAESLDNLATLFVQMGNYASAEPLYRRALNIREKVFGLDNSDVADTLSNLAALYHKIGDYDKAKPLCVRALGISEKLLGADHPDTAVTIGNLAFLNLDLHKPGEALTLAIRVERARESHLGNILSFTSEQQRLEFQQTVQPFNILATLGDASELAQPIMRNKGVVLDSLLEDRSVAEASKNPRQREVVTELRSAKQRLMQLQLETPRDTSEEALKKREAEKKELSGRVDALEAGLARQVAGLGRARRALSVTLAQVQRNLGKDETLIELLRYNHYLGKNKFEPRYGAVVIAPSGEPNWIPLGSATEIEKNIVVYQKSARGKTDEATLSDVLHALHTQLWASIEKALPSGTKTIIISPDGALNFVSFATLVGSNDKFVAEKYSIRYVASGRDLLRERKSSTSPMMFVYANPDFEAKAIAPNSASVGAATIAMRSLEMRDLQNLYLRPLPGTEAEASALEKRGGKSVKVFLGPNATEAQLRQVNSPRVLHLATHGFFLPEIELGKLVDPLQPGREIPKGKLVNPMHRSGLALAGAQTTLEAWARSEVPPTEDDGIVTAEEVGGLKLDETWLVVLSACDTGSGEARAGEGVIGLRRGFVQAGAQNLLMTLWPISDKATVQIMLDFYEAADKTHDAPEALAGVQRTWLVKLRKELGLRGAVKLAGPFIMSSQGKP